jgi:50S ribosomal protein L16 3-hydroxylase
MRLDIEAFLANFWQRQPLLIDQALPHFVSPIDGDDLAGVAGEAVCPSRLVMFDRPNDQWSVEHGPFGAERFASLPDKDWTLLVQDVDKLIDPVADLLEHFRFLPSWRLDDVMVSYATPGGSVGAHVDAYDVFLLQAAGEREWRIDRRSNPDRCFRDGVDLKLLKHFAPTDCWVLKPGDVLYLPPGVPHHGVAVSADCLTFSIGLRAPSAHELLADWIDTLLDDPAMSERFTDGTRSAPDSIGELDAESIARFEALLRRALDRPSEQRRRWLGEFLSRYRLGVEPTPRDRAIRPAAFLTKLAAGKTLSRNPFSRMLWQRSGDLATLHVSGQTQTCATALAQLVCDRRSLTHALLGEHLNDPAALALLIQLYNDGHFEFI